MQAQTQTISYQDKNKFYKELTSDLTGLLDSHWLMNLANFTALVKQHLPNINWVGFYLTQNQDLILGPFQGLPACTKIAFGKGVCGTSAAQKQTMVVKDVDAFPGHIVCDSASKSEIVVPLIYQDQVLGVLDIDSPMLDRFDSDDQIHLEKMIQLLIEKTKWTGNLQS